MDGNICGVLLKKAASDLFFLLKAINGDKFSQSGSGGDAFILRENACLRKVVCREYLLIGCTLTGSRDFVRKREKRWKARFPRRETAEEMRF